MGGDGHGDKGNLGVSVAGVNDIGSIVPTITEDGRSQQGWLYI